MPNSIKFMSKGNSRYYQKQHKKGLCQIPTTTLPLGQIPIYQKFRYVKVGSPIFSWWDLNCDKQGENATLYFFISMSRAFRICMWFLSLGKAILQD